MLGYYRNLCPHLDSVSKEGEGDLASASFMDQIDKSDTWQLDFLVPPIEGFVPQDEAGILTVPVAGDYGCDLTLDELSQTATLRVDLDEACVDFVSASPGGYSRNTTDEILTWTFKNVYYGDTKKVTIKVKATDVCNGSTTRISYIDEFDETKASGDEDLEKERKVLAAVAEVEEPEGMILGLATGANQIPFIIASLVMISTGLYLRRRTSPSVE